MPKPRRSQTGHIHQRELMDKAPSRRYTRFITAPQTVPPEGKAGTMPIRPTTREPSRTAGHLGGDARGLRPMTGTLVSLGFNGAGITAYIVVSEGETIICAYRIDPA